MTTHHATISLRTVFARMAWLGLLIAAMTLTGAKTGADEPAKSPPTETDKQNLAACSTLGQLLGTQRPEGVLVGAGMAALAANAEPAPAPAEVFVLEDRFRGHVAVAQIVGMHDGPTAALMLQRGLLAGLWMGKPEVDPLPDKELLIGIEDRRPVLNADQNGYESRAYRYLVLHARDVPADTLAKVARRDVSYAQLWDNPKQFRGEPIHIEGRLKKLLKMDAPKASWNDGIKTLYEGWVFPDDLGANPFCVIFSDLPKGISTGVKVEYRVKLDAYFFKRYRYKTVNNETRDAPLFIGRTFAVTGAQPVVEETGGSPFDGKVVPILTGFIGSMLALFFGLNWWFRRGDSAVQSRIREARGTGFVDPGANESPPSLPVEEQRGGNGSPLQ